MKRYLFGLLLGWTVATVLPAQNLENIGKEKPVRLGAGIDIQTGAYNTNSGDPREAPYTWVASGAPVLNIYGLQLPFSFSISNHNRSFQQPFNQFGVTPTWHWVKAYLGHNFVRFSPYTLAGHRFLGVGVELTPGKLRFGAVYGRFQKAIGPDSLVQPAQPNHYWSDVPIPAFSRYGYSIKLGFGSAKSYFDLIYFKAKDRSSSIIETATGLLPEENAVIGASSQVTLFKRITWKADVGISAYTRDLQSDTIDTKGWRFEKLLRKIMLPRNSTQLLAAGETGITYKDRRFGLRLSYKHIDPDYRTMGAYFFQNDLEMFTVTPSLTLLKGKFRFNGSLGSQRNNIYETKVRTTKRVIGNASLSMQLSKTFGVEAMYSNFGITQRPRSISSGFHLVDTLRLAQVSQQLMISPHVQLNHGTRSEYIGCSIQQSGTSDLNPVSTYMSAMKSFSAQGMYMISWRAHGSHVSLNLLYQQLSPSAGTSSSSLGINTGYGREFLTNKIRVDLGAGWYNNRLNGQKSGSTQQANANFSWQAAKNQSLVVGVQLLHNQSKSESVGSSFLETYFRMGWSIHFGNE